MKAEISIISINETSNLEYIRKIVSLRIIIDFVHELKDNYLFKQLWIRLHIHTMV